MKAPLFISPRAVWLLLLASGVTVFAQISVDPMFFEPEDANPDAPGDVDIPDGEKALHYKDRITLKGGDAFNGQLLAISAEKDGVVWAHKYTKTDIRFDRKSPTRIDFRKDDTVEIKPSGTIQLINGDVLRGAVESITATDIAVALSGGAKVTVPRDQVFSVSPFQKEGPSLFSAATAKKEDWQNPRDRWTYEEGIMTTATSDSKLGAKFPNKSKYLSFHFGVKMNPSTYFNWYIFTDNVNSTSATSYYLQFNRNNISVYRNDRNRGSKHITYVQNLPAMKGEKPIPFDLYVDKPNKQFHLFVNGKLAQSWTDNHGEFLEGEHFMFYNSNSSAVEIHDFKISRWNGTLPKTASEHAEAKIDTLILVNGDRFTGEIHTVENGKVSMTTSWAEVSVSLGRVRTANFAVEIPEKPVPVRGMDVRVRLRDGSLMTGQVVALNTKALELDSQTFGSASFATDAVQQIDFAPKPLKIR